VEPVRAARGERVQSVERSTILVARLAAEGAPMTALELARSTGLNRTIVHRLLRTLQDSAMVQETSPGRYFLGSALLLYGHAYVDRLPFRRASLPYLVDLGRQVVRDSPWVVALSVPVNTDVVLIDRIWHPHAPLDSILDVGTRMPLAGSAHGRAILSCHDAEYVNNLLQIGSDDPLHESLAQIRADGHIASSQNERQPGVSAIAAAVVGDDGQPIGSIGVSGIELEAELRADSNIGHHLLRTATAIERAVRGGRS
jgi:IclR family acetate operon transcriptional repressor